MSANIAVDLLEWLGTFFLAVEAIKLRNLQTLRIYIQQRFFSKDSMLKPNTRAAKIYHILAPIVGFGFIVLVVYALGYDPIALARRLNTYLESLPGPWNWFAAVAIGAPIYPVTAITGYLIMPMPYLLMLAPLTILLIIEANTANGIMGITGFTLFSVATILKVIGH